MNDTVMYPGGMLGQLSIALEKMGWESGDDVTVEIAGTQTYEIDGWHKNLIKEPKKLIKMLSSYKNRSRNPYQPSKPNDTTD